MSITVDAYLQTFSKAIYVTYLLDKQYLLSYIIPRYLHQLPSSDWSTKCWQLECPAELAERTIRGISNIRSGNLMILSQSPIYETYSVISYKASNASPQKNHPKNFRIAGYEDRVSYGSRFILIANTYSSAQVLATHQRISHSLVGHDDDRLPEDMTVLCVDQGLRSFLDAIVHSLAGLDLALQVEFRDFLGEAFGAFNHVVTNADKDALLSEGFFHHDFDILEWGIYTMS